MIRPGDFLSVAEALRNWSGVSGEPRYRTISGRAYYAAYSETCDALRKLHRLPAKAQFAHEVVSQTLASHKTDPEIRTFGTILETLRQSRVSADYRLWDHHEEQESEDAVEAAARLIALLPRVCTKLPRIDPKG